MDPLYLFLAGLCLCLLVPAIAGYRAARRDLEASYYALTGRKLGRWLIGCVWAFALAVWSVIIYPLVLFGLLDLGL